MLTASVRALPRMLLHHTVLNIESGPTYLEAHQKALEGTLDAPYAMYLCDVCTLPANMAGIPGISVPCGFSDGLPVGLQVIAPRFEDARVFRVAAAYEGATSWHTQQSPFAGVGT